MSEIASNLNNIKKTLPTDCTLVAVSKTKPTSLIQECYNAGHRDFGENKVQELVQKAEHLAKDIKWHMIGHLQRNKVKYIAPIVYLIHGVDSFKLLKEINKRAQQENRVIDCLLQVYIAEEESKFGFDKDELLQMIGEESFHQLENVQVVGLMGMATYTDDEGQIKKEFNALYRLFEQLKVNESKNLKMKTLSMGMSGDYRLALEEGSNMIRVGSAIFGARQYT